MGILDDILNQAAANRGKMPAVNPPAAASVLATATAAEVAGKPETSPAPTAVTSAPTAVTSAPSAAPSASTAVSGASEATEAKTRRTAAVVQAELDKVAAELTQVKAQLAESTSANERFGTELGRLMNELEALKAEHARACEALKQALEDAAKLTEGAAPTSDLKGTMLHELAAELRSRGFGIFTIEGKS